MTDTRLDQSLFDGRILATAIADSFRKLDPSVQWRNPVMFVVYVGTILTAFMAAPTTAHGVWDPYALVISGWLLFTVLFANFAEAIAEGRSRAQAASLRAMRQTVVARRLTDPKDHETVTETPASALRRGDCVIVSAGETIATDGEVIEGIASVDESAITGESAPVIRSAGSDFSSVTGGTKVLSDWLVYRVAADPGDTFLDRMIAMVEQSARQKTPNEIALSILLITLTIIFLLVVATLLPFSVVSVGLSGRGSPVGIVALVSLLVCLIPTTIGGLLSAIGVAGMSRMLRANVIATSGRAVEAAGDVDVLLLDKTGTITLGNRQASAFLPVPGITSAELADAAQLASLADETPEGRSIVAHAKHQHQVMDRDLNTLGGTFIPFSAATRMSGVDIGARRIRKGAVDAIRIWIRECGHMFPAAAADIADAAARRGSTPLVVADDRGVLGIVELKDVVKSGIRERFGELRRMGIRTIMITGDNPLTAAAIAAEAGVASARKSSTPGSPASAAAIAAEAGVDDFLAEATPETKLRLIREQQSAGHLVAMTGDGTNDAPALAQSDVAVAMNTGTQAAKEAGNMVDLDSNPTKLIEIVETGKQMLMTRGALTTFSIANDLAKYFAIIPAVFMPVYPELGLLNIMHLHSPKSAILAAVIFNALIIIALIPLAIRGVPYRAIGAAKLLSRNLAIYGLGGVVLPFPCIKLIDMLLVVLWGAF